MAELSDDLLRRQTDLLEQVADILRGESPSRRGGSKDGGLLNSLFRGSAESLRILHGSTDKASHSLQMFGHTAERALKFAGLGMAISSVIHSFREMVGTYSKLSDVGQTFGGSIAEMQVQAAQAGLGLDEFARSIQRNSIVAGSLGSSAFGQLSKNVRDNIKQFGYFGMTLSQADDMTGDLEESLRQTGFLTRDNAIKQGGAIAEMIKNVNDFSKATGRSREEIAKLVNEQMRSPGIANWLHGQSKQVNEAYQNMAAGLAAASPELLKMFSENLQNVNGSAMSATGKLWRENGFGFMNQLFDNFGDMVKAGMSNPKGFVDAIKRGLSTPGAQRQLKTWLSMTGTSQQAFAEQVMRINNELQDVDLAKKVDDSLNPLTQAALQLEGSLTALSASFRQGFWEGIIKGLAPANNDFTKFDDQLKEAGELLQGFGDVLGKGVGLLMEAAPAFETVFKGIIDFLSAVSDKLSSWLKSLGLGDQQSKSWGAFGTIVGAAGVGVLLKHILGRWFRMETRVANIYANEAVLHGRGGGRAGGGLSPNQMELDLGDKTLKNGKVGRLARWFGPGSRFSKFAGHLGGFLVGAVASWGINSIIDSLPDFAGKEEVETLVQIGLDSVGTIFGPSIARTVIGAFSKRLGFAMATDVAAGTATSAMEAGIVAGLPALVTVLGPLLFGLFAEKITDALVPGYKDNKDKINQIIQQNQGNPWVDPNPLHWFGIGMNDNQGAITPSDQTPEALSARLGDVSQKLIQDNAKLSQGDNSSELLTEIRDLAKTQAELQQALLHLTHRGNQQREDANRNSNSTLVDR